MNDPNGVAWQVTNSAGAPLFFSVDDVGPLKPRTQTYRIYMYVGDFQLRVRAFWTPDLVLSIVHGPRIPGRPAPAVIDMGVVDDIETAKSIMYSWYLLTNKGNSNGTT